MKKPSKTCIRSSDLFGGETVTLNYLGVTRRAYVREMNVIGRIDGIVEVDLKLELITEKKKRK